MFFLSEMHTALQIYLTQNHLLTSRDEYREKAELKKSRRVFSTLNSTGPLDFSNRNLSVKERVVLLKK